MKKLTAAERNALARMNKELKALEAQLSIAKKREGIDTYVKIKAQKRSARFEHTQVEFGRDKATGRFSTTLAITAQAEPVFIPLSIASGKSIAGFMYQVEGTKEATVARASVTVLSDEAITQIGVGSLQFVQIPAGKTAHILTDVTIRGRVGQEYTITFTRINYKLALSDSRYQHYLKPLSSATLRFKR